MRYLRPGGFSWLVAHELRLGFRAARRRTRGRAIAYVLLAAWVAIGIAIAIGLRGIPIRGGAMAYTAALAASALVMSFMTTQALLRSQHTLYESGDLDLLLSAPIEPRTVLLAKLCGIAGTIVLSYALLVLPIAIPAAALGHPGLFGIPALIAALALVSACLGLAITVAIVSIASPRAARTIGQVIGALLGGAIFLLSQIMSHDGGGRRSGVTSLFNWLIAHRIGGSGIGALPGRAALGDPIAAALLVGGAVAIFATTGALFGRAFLAGYQRAGMRVSPRRAASGSIERRFHAGLFGAMFAKEWRLLARDPALAFQIALRLIYLAPLALAAFGRGNGPPLAPALAFASVLIAGQLVGSFAWLAVSGEEAPDLLNVAPVSRRQVERAKLATALAMAAPLGLVVPLALATIAPLGALLTLAMTAAGGTLAGLIEIRWQKPAPRKTFARRRSGGFVAALLTLLVTALFGGAAAAGVWLLG